MMCKKLTQAVFEGLPTEYRWIAVDKSGNAFAYNRKPQVSVELEAFGYCTLQAAFGDHLELDEGYDTTDWQNSIIERETTIPVSEQNQALAEAQAEIQVLKKRLELMIAQHNAKLKCCEADLAKAKEEIQRLKWSNECLKRDAEWARDDAEDVKIRLFAGFIFLIGFVSVFFVF